MAKKKGLKRKVIAVILVALAMLLFLISPLLRDRFRKKANNPSPQTEFRNGDIIFQNSQSDQSAAIQAATGSPYSHCGIVFVQEGQTFVFEAVQPVKITPIQKWIARGKDGAFALKRLKHADTILTPATLGAMKA